MIVRCNDAELCLYVRCVVCVCVVCYLFGREGERVYAGPTAVHRTHHHTFITVLSKSRTIQVPPRRNK